MLHIIYFSEKVEARELSCPTLLGLTRGAGTQSTNQIQTEHTGCSSWEKDLKTLIKRSSPLNSKEGLKKKKKGSSINKNKDLKGKWMRPPTLLKVSLW